MEVEDQFDGCVDLAAESDLAEATLGVPSTAGVCLFCAEDDRAILLLYGADIRRLVRRRLAEDESGEKTRRTCLRPIVARIWFRRAYSGFEAQLAYFNIARELFPDKYEEFFGRLKAWFIRVNSRDDYPCFDKTDVFSPGSGLYWGPFGAKKSAVFFLETLQNMFDLCRCPHVLAQAPNATACSYAQMNRCAAVCDGTVSTDEYRLVVEQAIDFLAVPLSQAVGDLGQEMKDFSAALRFEQAEKVKTKLDQARKLLTTNFRWVMPLDRFYVLCFQPGPGLKSPGRRGSQPTVTPFLIGPDGINQIEPLPLDKSEQVAQKILDHLNLKQMQSIQGGASQPKLLAWAAQFLYRNVHDKGLYLSAEDKLTAEELSQKLKQHFAQPTKTKKKPKLDAFSLTAQEEKPGRGQD